MSRNTTATEPGPGAGGPRRAAANGDARNLPDSEIAIATGTARIVTDPHGDGATLYVNDAPSSYIAFDDPARLDFEYQRWSAAVIETHLAAAGTGDVDFPSVLHLGAGACALARALVARIPSSRHLAIEIDPVLAEHVRVWFDLPRSPALRIRVQDAREALTATRDSRFEVIVRDVFEGTSTPSSLLDAATATEVRRALTPSGIYIANCADRPPLRALADEIATFRSVFPVVAIIGEPAQLKGRRYGNILVVGAHRPLPRDLDRRLRADPAPARLVEGVALDPFAAKAHGNRVAKEP